MPPTRMIKADEASNNIGGESRGLQMADNER